MILLFDLDGTLTDSEEGIVNAFKYTIDKLNLQERPVEELRKYIGPPLDETLRKHFGVYGSRNDEAFVYFKEYMKKGRFENKPYKGIRELLEKYSKNNILALASSKNEDQAVDILKYFKLDYFDFIGAATDDNTRSKKSDVINYVLENLHVENRDNVYMIGDRFTDINGAKICGIKSIGVLWGFGSREELEKCNPDYIVESVEELDTLLGKLYEKEKELELCM